MSRYSRWISAGALLALPTLACSHDIATAPPEISADRVATPKKLKDAIAFFTRDFSPSDGGLALMGSDGSGRRPLPGGELGFEPHVSPDGRTPMVSRWLPNRLHV